MQRTTFRLAALFTSVVSWTYIGRPGGAKLVTGTTALALFVPYGVIYALNDDNSLWKSTSGSDGSWQYVGRPGLAARIAAGGSELEAKPFALNTDGTLWLSGGDGCDGYWHQITDKLAAQEITAASAFKLYALDYDKTLWVGTVTGADNLTSVRSDGQPQHCDGHTLVTNRCGEDNQNCCANASCNGGYACGGGNTCEPCGGLGQLACAGGVCNDHDWQPGAGGRCEHCGSTHERACGGTRCNEVHRAPDKDGKCEFDHWCGGEGQQCCEATEFGGNCNSGMNCVFRLFDPNVCRRPVPGGGGGGGGISLCTGNQNPRDFCATVTCLSGYYDTERATACTQDSADLIIANRHTDCRVEPIHCP